MADKSSRYNFHTNARAAARDVLSLAEALQKLKQVEGRTSRTRTEGPDRGQRDAHIRAYRMQQQAAEKAAKAQARTAAASAKATEAAEKAKTRTEDREAAKRYRAAGQRSAQRVRQIQSEVAAEQRVRQQGARRMASLQAQHNRKQHQEQVLAMRRRHSLVGAVGMGTVGLAAAVLGTGISEAFGAVRDREEAQKLSRQLSTAGRRAGQQGVDPAALLGDADRVAAEVRGTKAESALQGMAAYVQSTGDLTGARRHASAFATAARATGAADADMAKVGAVLSQKFGITDAGQMKETLAGLIEQGKSGAFEMADMAKYVAELGASGERFGLRGEKGVMQLGSLAQVARMSTGTGAEASTAAQAALRQLIAKSADIKQMAGGKELVFTDKGHTKARDMNAVLADTIGAAKGDQQKLQKIFGDEGIRGVSALVTEYNRAADAAGKSASASEKQAAGHAAVTSMLEGLQAAGGSWGDVMADAATNTDTFTDVMEQGADRLKKTMADELEAPLKELAKTALPLAVPAVKAFAKELAGATVGLTALLKKLGVDLPTDEPTKETPWGIRQAKLDGEAGVLQAKIAAGTATDADKARLKAVQAEQSQLSKEHAIGTITSRKDKRDPLGLFTAGDIEKVAKDGGATSDAIAGRFGGKTGFGDILSEAMGGGFFLRTAETEAPSAMGIGRRAALAPIQAMTGGANPEDIASVLMNPAKAQESAARDLVKSADAISKAAESLSKVGGSGDRGITSLARGLFNL